MKHNLYERKILITKMDYLSKYRYRSYFFIGILIFTGLIYEKSVEDKKTDLVNYVNSINNKDKDPVYDLMEGQNLSFTLFSPNFHVLLKDLHLLFTYNNKDE